MKINPAEKEDTAEAETEPPGHLRVGITFNLKKNISSELTDAEAEFDDMETIEAIKSVLEAEGFVVELYEAAEELPIRLLNRRPDIVFNIAEGSRGRGREAQVPAILNYLGIPFTGSDETTMCIAMDKALTKRLISSHGVRTPEYRLVKKCAPPPEMDLPFPVIVKPNTEGSSKGISEFSIVHDEAALRRLLEEKINAYKQDMLIEEYISGREFTVGILGNPGRLRVFPPMEIIFDDRAGGIYSYEVKRNFRQYVRYECPPAMDARLLNEIGSTAEIVFRSLSCRDLARIDFRLSEEGRLYFIEINPLPGLASGYSDFPMLAEYSGMDHETLIRSIMGSALSRYNMPMPGKRHKL